MKIKIVSDGTTRGTHITNAETGEPIEGVTRIQWDLYAGDIGRVSLTFLSQDVDVIGETSRSDDGPEKP